MSAHPESDRVLALAGVHQACALVQQIARQGRCDEEPWRVSLESVLRVDAPSTEAVFGSRAGLTLGLELVARQALGRGSRDLELTRYVATVLHLERRLTDRRDLMQTLAAGIELASRQAEVAGDPVHPDVVATLADVYQRTVSTLSPRIMVTGTPEILRQPATAERIRAALLAAMRAAVLWRQVGGSRLGLILRRRSIARTTAALLAPPPGPAEGEAPGRVGRPPGEAP